MSVGAMLRNTTKFETAITASVERRQEKKKPVKAQRRCDAEYMEAELVKLMTVVITIQCQGRLGTISVCFCCLLVQVQEQEHLPI